MLQAALNELGYSMQVDIKSDASSAIAAAEKKGVLRFKHLAIKWLLMKELTERKQICIKKVGTLDMVADFLTKPVDVMTMRRNLKQLPGLCFVDEEQGSSG